MKIIKFDDKLTSEHLANTDPAYWIQNLDLLWTFSETYTWDCSIPDSRIWMAKQNFIQRILHGMDH